MLISIRQRLTAWYAAVTLLGPCPLRHRHVGLALYNRLVDSVDARLALRMTGTPHSASAPTPISEIVRTWSGNSASSSAKFPTAAWCSCASLASTVLPAFLSSRSPHNAPTTGRSPNGSAVAPSVSPPCRIATAGAVFDRVAIPLDDPLAVLQDLPPPPVLDDPRRPGRVLSRRLLARVPALCGQWIRSPP